MRCESWLKSFIMTLHSPLRGSLRGTRFPTGAQTTNWSLTCDAHIFLHFYQAMPSTRLAQWNHDDGTPLTQSTRISPTARGLSFASSRCRPPAFTHRRRWAIRASSPGLLRAARGKNRQLTTSGDPRRRSRPNFEKGQTSSTLPLRIWENMDESPTLPLFGRSLSSHLAPGV